jgi:energy-coupling factor transporter ATP-binding protein EcfA2
VTGYETATVRLRGPAGRGTAGLGLLVTTKQVVTCAHVVNAALGREPRNREPPGESVTIQVEFLLLAEPLLREAKVAVWVPPLQSGGGGDVAGLVLIEEAPGEANPAHFATVAPQPGVWLRAFGYPGRPPRPNGVYVDVNVKGVVSGQLLQVESQTNQTVKAQPGFSGSPAWNPGTGEAVGLLQSAPFADEPERDAYLLPAMAFANAWDEPFHYLLVPDNPYRGLEPFTAEHAGLFFGRDTDIAELTARVRENHVVVVVGPSGVGKSSLVQAGLVPALKQDQSSEVALIRLGQDPWERLAEATLIARSGPQATVTLEQVEREIEKLKADGLHSIARFLRSQGRPLLLIVDQFEELLISGKDPDPGLLDLLLPPEAGGEEAARMVLTLRTDFLRALQTIPGLHTRLNDRLYLLSSLTTDQMREAIQGPAAARGVTFEPGLVDQILIDVGRDALPLLEFTLTVLWDTQSRNILKFAGYYQMGGIRGALDLVAKEEASQIGDTVTDILDRALLRLVRMPNGGTDLATGQRVSQSDVSTAEWELLRRLAEARLVVLGTGSSDDEPYAELAHEALITEWQRLRDLITQNKEFLNWLAWVQRRAADKDPLPEARIAEARQWLKARPNDVPDIVTKFVESSETAAEFRLRELRDARDRAEALRLAAEAELALRTARSPTVVALGLSVESLLVQPTVQGDVALRHVFRVHPLTLAPFAP